MKIIQLIYGFAVIFLAGKALLDLKPLHVRKLQASIRFPLYFFAGSMAVAAYMLILAALKIKFNVLVISLPFLLYAVILLLKLRPLDLNIPLAKEFDRPIFRLLAAVLAIVCIAMFLDCSIIPIFSKDAFAMWCFKAKIFFMERTVPFSVLAAPAYAYTSPEYPQLIPLNLAWLSLCLGQYDDVLIRLFFAVQFVLFITAFYSLSRGFMSKWPALAGTFVLFTNKHFLVYAANGYADATLSAFIFLSLVFFIKWLNEKDEGALYLSSLFAGGAAFTKNEGMVVYFVLMAMLAARLWKSDIRTLTAFALIGGLFFVPYQAALSSYGISSHMIKSANILATAASNIGRAPQIARHFLYELYLNTFAWQYFWIFLTALYITGRRNFRRMNMNYAAVFLALVLAAYFMVYMVTAADNLYSSFHRLLLGMAPAAVLLAFVLNSKEVQ